METWGNILHEGTKRKQYYLQVLQDKNVFLCGLLTLELVPQLRDTCVREMVPQ